MEHSLLIQRDGCPVCGGKPYNRFLTCRDHTVSAQDFDIVACKSCDFRYTNPVPAPEHIGAYYKSEEYISHSDTKKGLVARLYHLVRGRALQQKRTLIEGLTPGRTLLDYGCGTGAFLRSCKEAGWTVCGEEPDAEARAKVGMDIQVYSSFNDLVNTFGRKVDVITLWHVLEHVYEPGELLRFASAHLNPGGALVIAVPNYRSFDGVHYGRHWAAYDVPRHLSHFSRSSMADLLSRNGFTCESVRPMVFDSFYVSLLSEKYKTGSQSFVRAFITGLLSNIRAKRTKEYSSLIYICRPV